MRSLLFAILALGAHITYAQNPHFNFNLVRIDRMIVGFPGASPQELWVDFQFTIEAVNADAWVFGRGNVELNATLLDSNGNPFPRPSFFNDSLDVRSGMYTSKEDYIFIPQGATATVQYSTEIKPLVTGNYSLRLDNLMVAPTLESLHAGEAVAYTFPSNFQSASTLVKGAVPEPTLALLIAVGGMGVLTMQRRRTQ